MPLPSHRNRDNRDPRSIATSAPEPPLAIASGTTPAPSVPPAFPPARMTEVSRLVSEARDIHAKRSRNHQLVGDLNAENAAIGQRLVLIEAEIRRIIWDGEPLA